jgi:hypothetical protein
MVGVVLPRGGGKGAGLDNADKGPEGAEQLRDLCILSTDDVPRDPILLVRAWAYLLRAGSGKPEMPRSRTPVHRSGGQVQQEPTMKNRILPRLPP